MDLIILSPFRGYVNFYQNIVENSSYMLLTTLCHPGVIGS